MSLIVLSVDRDKLPQHTYSEYVAWVNYQVGNSCELSLENPLSHEGVIRTQKLMIEAGILKI